MLLYFYLLDRRFFEDIMVPCLAQSYRQISLAPGHELCRFLLARDPGIPEDAVVRSILAGLPFDRTFWHGLVGECLVHGAADILRLQTAPDALCCLLAPAQVRPQDVPRAHYAPIQQAHFGTRDLVFGGGYYRPDHAGLNDIEDVRRLAVYLQAIDPAGWTAAALTPLAECTDDAERAEELAYARDWWPSLVELYQGAKERGQVVVCETV
jgi:hypothetical protein